MKFNKKGLSKDLIAIINNNLDHGETSRAIEMWINANKPKDVNVYLCWAHYEWLCPLYTEFDEDFIEHGKATLKILDLALSLEPENAEALKNKIAVEKRIKKAQKSIDTLFKYDKMDIINSIWAFCQNWLISIIYVHIMEIKFPLEKRIKFTNAFTKKRPMFIPITSFLK